MSRQRLNDILARKDQRQRIAPPSLSSLSVSSSNPSNPSTTFKTPTVVSSSILSSTNSTPRPQTAIPSSSSTPRLISSVNSTPRLTSLSASLNASNSVQSTPRTLSSIDLGRQRNIPKINLSNVENEDIKVKKPSPTLMKVNQKYDQYTDDDEEENVQYGHEQQHHSDEEDNNNESQEEEHVYSKNSRDNRDTKEEEESDDDIQEATSSSETHAINKQSILRLIKNSDLKGLMISGDIYEASIEVLKQILDDIVVEDAALTSNDINEVIEGHFINGQDDLPQETVFTSTGFERFVKPIFQKRNATYKRDSFYLLQLFTEAFLVKMLKGAEMICTGNKRSKILGRDLQIAYAIYSS